MKKLLVLYFFIISCHNPDYVNPKKLINKKGFEWETEKIKNINYIILKMPSQLK